MTSLLRNFIKIALFVDLVTSQKCSPLKELHAYKDKRLDNYQISHMLGLSLYSCATECWLVKMCKSFNHKLTYGICELNSVNLDDVIAASSLKDEDGFEYCDIRQWPPELARSCATRPCAENQRCLPTTPYTCVDIDCGPPPVFTLADSLLAFDIVPVSSATTLGSRIAHRCDDPRFDRLGRLHRDIPFYNSMLFVCNPDSTWSRNEAPLCLGQILGCDDVKRCNPNYGDGHYWIWNGGSFYRRIKVYCGNMAGSPRTYVTLPADENVSVRSGFNNVQSRTVFRKVRVDDYWHVLADDFTFAATSGQGWNDYMEFAYTESCGAMVDGEKAYAYFKINLRGTGLKLSSDYDRSYSSDEIMEVHVTKDRLELNATCWMPDCGSCRLTPPRFTYDTNDVDGSDTVLPSDCVEYLTLVT